MRKAVLAKPVQQCRLRGLAGAVDPFDDNQLAGVRMGLGERGGRDLCNHPEINFKAQQLLQGFSTAACFPDLQLGRFVAASVPLGLCASARRSSTAPGTRVSRRRRHIRGSNGGFDTRTATKHQPTFLVGAANNSAVTRASASGQHVGPTILPRTHVSENEFYLAEGVAWQAAAPACGTTMKA